METDLITLIAQFGFPIVMCLWFMLRTEKIIAKNTEALDRLGDLVEKLCERRKLK